MPDSRRRLRRRGGLHGLDPLSHLPRELDERLGAFRRWIEDHTRQPIAGRLSQSDIARDDRVEYLFAEMTLQLLTDLLLQRDAGVEHHPQKPDHFQIGVEVGMNL